MADKVCVICGAVFHPRNHRQICCSKKCSDENNRRINKDRNNAWRKERQEKTQKANEALALQCPSVCDRFCDGCVFVSYGSGGLRICGYYIRTNRRRPCPAGTGCTVKNTGKRKTTWRYEADETWKTRQQREEKRTQGKEVFHRKCLHCGKEFDTTDVRKIFCCRTCASRHKSRVQYRRKKGIHPNGDANI